MIDVSAEISQRASSSGIHENLLTAVFLREMHSLNYGGESARKRALSRVDRFIIYACVRDSTCARDRDLVEYMPVHPESRYSYT